MLLDIYNGITKTKSIKNLVLFEVFELKWNIIIIFYWIQLVAKATFLIFI